MASSAIIDPTGKRDVQPISNNGSLQAPLLAELRLSPAFHGAQQQNKEAFAKQGRIPKPRKGSMLHLVPDSALRHIKREDEDRWVDRFVSGLLAAQHDIQNESARRCKESSLPLPIKELPPLVDDSACNTVTPAARHLPPPGISALPASESSESKLTIDGIHALRHWDDPSTTPILSPQPTLPLLVRSQGALSVSSPATTQEAAFSPDDGRFDLDLCTSESEDEDSLFIRSPADANHRRHPAQSSFNGPKTTSRRSASFSNEPHGLDIARPKTAKDRRPSPIPLANRYQPDRPIQTTMNSSSALVRLAAAQSRPQTLGPFYIKSEQLPYPAYSDRHLEIIDLDSPPPTPSATLQAYNTSTNLAVQTHLTAIRSAAADIPAWNKLLHSANSRRSQLHRWFGLYTTWENDAAFTEVDRREWRRCLVLLTRDYHALSSKKAPVSKGGVFGEKGTPIQRRTRNGISGRIMKKRESWFV